MTWSSNICLWYKMFFKEQNKQTNKIEPDSQIQKTN